MVISQEYGPENVIPKGEDYVDSETFGLIRTRTGLWMDSRCSQEYPHIPKLFNRWLRGRLKLHPEFEMNWRCSSITMNGSFASKRHRDENNVGPSAIRAFGSTSGGDLDFWPTDPGKVPVEELNPANSVRLAINDANLVHVYDGRKAHEVTEYRGDRFSLIFFMRKGCHDTKHGTLISSLESKGFRIPRDEGEIRRAEEAISSAGGYISLPCRDADLGGEHVGPVQVTGTAELPPSDPESELQQWTRIDISARHYMTSLKGGPRWESVRRRDTFQLNEDKSLGPLILSEKVKARRLNEHDWHDKLPRQ